MALKYYFISRKILAGENKGQTMLHAQTRAGNLITTDMLTEELSHSCTVSSGDVKAVFQGLIIAMRNALKSGKSVKLNDLGNFRLNAGSSGVEDYDQFNLRLMRTPKIIFVPGKYLTKLRRKATYSKEEIKTLDLTKPCEEEHAEP